MTNVFGYAASAILVATIASQIRQQWRMQSTKGVSPWLFAGQIAASAGFVAHSALIGSGLFVVTNLLVGAAAIVGMVLFAVIRRRTAAAREREPEEEDAEPYAPASSRPDLVGVAVRARRPQPVPAGGSNAPRALFP